ncbi:MAG: hypothetical protein WCE21_01480 [Candidatus Babeliales bacterium]
MKKLYILFVLMHYIPSNTFATINITISNKTSDNIVIHLVSWLGGKSQNGAPIPLSHISIPRSSSGALSLPYASIGGTKFFGIVINGTVQSVGFMKDGTLITTFYVDASPKSMTITKNANGTFIATDMVTN